MNALQAHCAAHDAYRPMCARCMEARQGAAANSEQSFQEKVVPLNAWRGKLASSSKGLKRNITNLMLCLQNIRELGSKIRWNELAQRVEWNGHPLEDSDLVTIRLILEANEFEPPVGDLLPAIIRHAKDNAFHPVRDYLTSLEWDGVPRLDHWLQHCLGAMDSVYTRAIGRRILIAAVARAFRPGCKVDTVLVIEGPQGLKKSTAIAALFGEQYAAESVNLFDQHNKMVMAMMGAWVVELAEFVAIQRRDQNTVKGMLSMRSDRVVLPYAKMASDHPRQCIFFGTINPEDFGYLTDRTGNRRYWFVRANEINLDLIRDRRDQFWAEAYKAFQNNERWWLEGEEENLAADVAAEREELDPWEEIFIDKLASYQTITATAALIEIGSHPDRITKADQNRAGRILRKIGFVRDEKPTKDADRKSIFLFRRTA